MAAPRAQLVGLEVFAVEPTSAQLTWRHATGPVTVTARGRPGPGPAVVWDRDGPGAVVVSGLCPGTTTELVVAAGTGRARRPTTAVLPVTTPEALPGPVRCRVATLSDLHLGARRFGYLGTISPGRPVAEPPSVTAARAALAESVAWGADLVVIKGDVTDRGRDEEWAMAADLIARVPVPVMVLAGNHDRNRHRTIEPAKAAERHGLDLVDGVATRDLDGARLVVVETTLPPRTTGRVAHRTEATTQALAGADQALVLLHHHLEDRRELPLWPPGIPPEESRAFLDALDQACPGALVSSGHSHKHRCRRHRSLTVTQVGATLDHPGTWAGYTVTGGGIRQVVRRIADPACLAWSERAGRAAAGRWRHWAPGTLADRCLSVRWRGPTGDPGGQRTV